MSRFFSHACLCLIAVLGSATLANAQNHSGHDHAHNHNHDGHAAAETAANGELGDPYYLTTDPVTGDALPALDQQVRVQHEGRELRFANEANHAAFRKTPAKIIAALDKQMIADQLEHYPIETCVVSDEPLGDQPVDYIYRNRLVRFCCKGCRGDFLKDPDAYLTKLNEAVAAKQAENYSPKTCPVSKLELGAMGDPVDVVIANRLVRLCCAGCKGQLLENPARFLTALHAEHAHDRHDEHAGHRHDHK